ncbi:MAG: helix-turn-helix domain-containing protein [Rikenellaceae bacterium]|nr:helix-turn-helix domain-containing protein [Rikenellaceae bacterium]
MERLYKYFGGDYLEGQLLLSELNPRRINRSWNNITSDAPLTTGNAVFYIILSGVMEINIDKRTIVCSAEKNNFLHPVPFNVIYRARGSEDLSGYMFVVTKKFLDENLGGKRPFHPDDMQEFQFSPAIDLDSAPVNEITQVIKEMKYKFSDQSHKFREEIILLKGLELLLEIASVIKKKKTSDPVDTASRLDRLVRQLYPLLMENCRKHHEVSFYAEKLCITPQYLNKLTKAKLGRPASNIIADVLITESILLLQNPELSIQQIAEKLHFSDQSSFGKFFKKHTGQSPLMYRKGLVWEHC